MQNLWHIVSTTYRRWLGATGWMILLTASAGSLSAQVPVPIPSGVSVGSVHLIVRDPAEYRKLLGDILGATVVHSGSLELLKIPGLLIVLEKGEPTGPSGGSSLNHIGLWIKDYDQAKAKVIAAQLEIPTDNYKAAECAAAPGSPACQMIATFPNGVRIEFTEDKQLTTTSAFHHIHLFGVDPEGIRAWYANTFGGTPYLRRGTILATMFDSGEVDINRTKEPQAPTQSRAIDRFGLEVKGLEAFIKKLEAAGVKVDSGLQLVPGTKIRRAFITDPMGARIELTEGLAAR